MQHNKAFLRRIFLIFIVSLIVTISLQHFNFRRNFKAWVDFKTNSTIKTMEIIDDDFSTASSDFIRVVNRDALITKIVNDASYHHKVSTKLLDNIKTKLITDDITEWIRSQDESYTFVNSFVESQKLHDLVRDNDEILKLVKENKRSQIQLNAYRQKLFRKLSPFYRLSHTLTMDQVRVLFDDGSVLVTIDNQDSFNSLNNSFGYLSEVKGIDSLNCNSELFLKAKDNNHFALRQIVPLHQNSSVVGSVECNKGLFSVEELLEKQESSSNEYLWLKNNILVDTENEGQSIKTLFNDSFTLFDNADSQEGDVKLMASSIEQVYYTQIRDKFYKLRPFSTKLSKDGISMFALFLPILDSDNNHFGFFIRSIDGDYYNVMVTKRNVTTLLTVVFVASVLMLIYFIQCRRTEKGRVNQALGTVTEKLLEGLFVINRNGTIRFANKAGTLFFGMKKEDIIGIKVENLLKKITFEGSDNWDTIIANIDKSGYYTNDECIIKLDNVTIAVSLMGIYIAPQEEIIHDFQDSIVLMVNDITHHKLYERQLLRAKEEAEVNDRLKSTFLNNFSHEIRTPLNSIVGFSYLMKNEETPKETVERYVDIIHTNSDYLLRVVQNIIEISQLEQDEYKLYPDEFSINAMMKELFNDVESTIKNSRKPIKLICKTGLEDDQDHTFSDAKRLRAVLEHLLDNAVKFTELGHIEFGYQVHDNDNLLFWVKDTGIGIDSSEQYKIFKPFYQIKDGNHIKFSGTGLGLSIASRVVQLMGGNIWVKSEYTQGTTMYFAIPFITRNSIDDELAMLGIEE